MELTKKNIDLLIKNFSLLKQKNTIAQKNLTKFDGKNKTDALYLSFINSENQHYITFLNYIVKQIKPKNIVELGNREGLSTIALYDAAKEVGSDFYSIDIEEDQRYCPPQMFNDSQMHFLFGDVCSLEIINKLPKSIDLLFTDTLHFDFQLRDEWEIYQHLLSDKALVAIDDINIHDKRKLFDELNFEKWDLTELCHANGWGLFLFIRKEAISQEEQEKRISTAIIQVWERKYEALFKHVESTKEKQLLSKLKKILKKVKPAYYMYTYIFNILNLKINQGKVMTYSRSIRA